VGVYSISIFWRDLINNILPHDSDGIVVVFENACNQTFTYEINGPEVHYLGPGDLHDEKYDYLGLVRLTQCSDRKSVSRETLRLTSVVISNCFTDVSIA
jgi:hypothetical protein